MVESREQCNENGHAGNKDNGSRDSESILGLTASSSY